MATDPLLDLFLSGLANPNIWLENISRQEIADIRNSSIERQDSGCVLADMGDFLVRATLLLSQLPDSMTAEKHVSIYTSAKLEEMDRKDDFSELHGLDYLHKKHASLKSVPHKPSSSPYR
jgi:hypothetical protein